MTEQMEAMKAAKEKRKLERAEKKKQKKERKQKAVLTELGGDSHETEPKAKEVPETKPEETVQEVKQTEQTA
jgi:hypothetical protein